MYALCTIATAGPDGHHESYSQGCLKSLAEQAPGKPITVNDYPVGRIRSAWPLPSNVLCLVDVPEETLGKYAVLGLSYEAEDIDRGPQQTTIVRDATLWQLLITATPSDANLLPLTRLFDADLDLVR
jgi:hypothetical protein